ncbi:hypothetical protein PIB30_064257 [Stylosanthes scabra]|uniref:Uncharacterized protein n=1 Tax=Stylosanthes scabra TaxID=79078 RepID=A0ABU6XKM3_9FABA|nr:hypothetical protein [Stylosanthes scabra]
MEEVLLRVLSQQSGKCTGSSSTTNEWVSFPRGKVDQTIFSIGVEKSMRKAKKNTGSKNGVEKACKSGDFTKEARMRSREKEL